MIPVKLRCLPLVYQLPSAPVQELDYEHLPYVSDIHFKEGYLEVIRHGEYPNGDPLRLFLVILLHQDLRHVHLDVLPVVVEEGETALGGHLPRPLRPLNHNYYKVSIYSSYY